MRDAPPRCEPPAGARERDGWHWVEFSDGRVVAIEWHPKTNSWWQGSSFTPAGSTAQYRWRYLAPVTPPAVVRGLVEALEAALSASLAGRCCTTDEVVVMDAALKAAKGAGV